VLGSPIRTPPDHSSVANSPGLIAGSYVLHRLLMPRHPPCALHSLSHKHSTKTTKTLTPPKRRQKVTTPGEEPSQMLASTIQFTRYKPTAATSPRTGNHWPAQAVEGLIPQSPTACQDPPSTPAPPGSTPASQAGHDSTEETPTHRRVVHRRFH
jgi:hypothetical protein